MKITIKRAVTNDKDIRLTIIQYKDRQNNIVNLAYLCLEKDRQSNGNYVDNGKLFVYVNEKELYRIPFQGTFTDERSSALTKHLNVREARPNSVTLRPISSRRWRINAPNAP